MTRGYTLDRQSEHGMSDDSALLTRTSVLDKQVIAVLELRTECVRSASTTDAASFARRLGTVRLGTVRQASLDREMRAALAHQAARESVQGAAGRSVDVAITPSSHSRSPPHRALKASLHTPRPPATPSTCGRSALSSVGQTFQRSEGRSGPVAARHNRSVARQHGPGRSPFGGHA